jgi:hypothetical protein
MSEKCLDWVIVVSIRLLSSLSSICHRTIPESAVVTLVTATQYECTPQKQIHRAEPLRNQQSLS